MINIMLVDDQTLVRYGMLNLLNQIKGMRVVSAFSCGEEAISWMQDEEALNQQGRPRVVVMEIKLPDMEGIELIQRLIRIDPDIKILVLTTTREHPHPMHVLQAGASGYLVKSCRSEELISAIRKVSAGQRYISSDVAQQIALMSVTPVVSSSPFEQLSDRELQVMHLIVQGYRIQDISEQLNLSPKTINSYRYRIHEKLRVGGDIHMTHLALRHRIIKEPQYLRRQRMHGNSKPKSSTKKVNSPAETASE